MAALSASAVATSGFSPGCPDPCGRGWQCPSPGAGRAARPPRWPRQPRRWLRRQRPLSAPRRRSRRPGWGCGDGPHRKQGGVGGGGPAAAPGSTLAARLTPRRCGPPERCLPFPAYGVRERRACSSWRRIGSDIKFTVVPKG